MNTTSLETNKNTLEFLSDQIVIVFDPEGKSQKFVQLKDDNGNTLVASYPFDDGIRLHMHVLMKAVEYFKNHGKKVTKVGGGMLQKEAGKIIISGTSTQLGDFNKNEVLPVLQKSFPELEIVVE